jgi:predicted Zn-dependent protease
MPKSETAVPMRLRLAATAALLALLVACATNPVTGRRELMLMSEGQEIAIGQEMDPEIRAEMGLYDDPALQQYLTTLGMRLAKSSERPNLPWQFRVVDQPAINAFAVPGGFIYFTRGILAFLDDEAELVGVLGHEIGHVTARHSAQQYSRAVGGQLGLAALGVFVPAARPFGAISETALGVLFLSYGREAELQADELGARYAAANGWDPAGVPGMLTTLGRLDEAAGDRRGIPNWLSTHPEPLARVKEIQPLVQELSAGRTGLARNRDEMLKHVDGMLFGDNPDQGVVQDSAFLHPPLRFRIDFPSNWQVANSPRQVVAQPSGADAAMVLQLVEQPRGTNIRDIAIASMQGAGLRLVQGERTTINGLEAFVGVYEGQIEGLGPVASRAGHIRHDGRIYLVVGLVPPGAFRQADATFDTSIRSFRPLSASEAESIRPDRVDIHVVRQGDTWEALAERSRGAIRAPSLAIMNNHDPGQQPQPGTRVKVVVGG